ncbi:MAG: hypothetical protein AABX52_02425 [Nanoarchaeota archaeon]
MTTDQRRFSNFFIATFWTLFINKFKESRVAVFAVSNCGGCDKVIHIMF